MPISGYGKSQKKLAIWARFDCLRTMTFPSVDAVNLENRLRYIQSDRDDLADDSLLAQL